MVSYKMFAGTHVGLRENNEDNFTVNPDLMKNEWIVPADSQQVIQLGSRGCVMVVADGMGGQNAGEVASAIAIDTVEDLFSPEKLSPDVFAKSDAIISFLKKVISECDVRIKKRAEEDPATEGMGSTIVIAWLIGAKLYIAWLGDSRAYSFVKSKGIARLSKDHSYVQKLVDAGTLTDEEAMNHPNSNIITRSLGDTSQKAKADVAEYDIEDGQVILLCSDGLCGVCRDEEIGGIIEEECSDLQKCKECLTTAALEAGGSDNITISLLQVSVDSEANSQIPENTPNKSKKNSLSTVFAILFGLGLFSSLLYVGYSLLFTKEPSIVSSIELKVDKDSLATNETTNYHVVVSGEALTYDIIYDKSLLYIKTKDSLICRAKTLQLLLGDRETLIMVVCKEDTTLRDSVYILLTKDEVEDILDTDSLESDRPVVRGKEGQVNGKIGKTKVVSGNIGTCFEVTESFDNGPEDPNEIKKDSNKIKRKNN